MEDIKKMTVNVGIKYHQKERIIKFLSYGESINEFVQTAVEKELRRIEKDEFK